MKLNKKEFRERLKVYLGTGIYMIALDELYKDYKENGRVKSEISCETFNNVFEYFKKLNFKKSYNSYSQELRIKKGFEHFAEWFNERYI